MFLKELFETIKRTGQGDTAVIGWGRGMGHKGHMMLASSVITQAKKINGDPYFVVSRTVGKDDPVYPEEKIAIYKKVFPDQSHIFQTATDELPDLTKVLSNLNKQGYKNATVVLGDEESKDFQFLKQYNGKPNKKGEVIYDFENFNVIGRSTTGDPSAGQEGPRATPMRNILNDPNASPEQQFQLWRDAMSPEVSDDEVRDLMNKAKERMSQFAAPKKKNKDEKKEKVPMEGRRDYGYDDFGNSLRPGHDEGNTEPGNNFAIYINGRKWKVFPGPYGAYADSPEEQREFYRLKDMAARKSQQTGKKWEVYKTGEPATK